MHTPALRRSRSLARRVLTATATCLFVGGLSACAGNGSAGVYLAVEDDDLGALTIEGTAVTYAVSHCGEDVDTGTGELTEDGAGVVWAEGGTSTVAFTDGSVGLDDMTFAKEGTDAADGVTTEHEGVLPTRPRLPRPSLRRRSLPRRPPLRHRRMARSSRRLRMANTSVPTRTVVRCRRMSRCRSPGLA